MATLSGFKEVEKALRDRAKGKAQVSVVTGYTAAYSLFVHEDMGSHHPNGQAKFLEQPAREFSIELGRIVREAYQNGAPLDQACLTAALRLQRESQQLVPVDTSNLKNSAFSEIEE